MPAKLVQIQDAIASDQFQVGGESWNQFVKLHKNIDISSDESEDIAFNTPIYFNPGKLLFYDQNPNPTHTYNITVENIASGNNKTITIRESVSDIDYILLENHSQVMIKKTLGSETKFSAVPDFQGHGIDNLGILKIHDVGDRNVPFLDVSNSNPNTYFEILANYNTSNFAGISGATDIKVRLGFGSEIDGYEFWSQADGSNSKLIGITETLLDINTGTVNFNNATINNILLAKSQIPNTTAYTDQANVFTEKQTIQKQTDILLDLYRNQNTQYQKWDIEFNADNSASTKKTFGKIETSAETVTDTSEMGYMLFYYPIAGTLARRFWGYNNQWAFGASGAEVWLSGSGLTGNRTFTFQDASGKLPLLEFANIFTTLQKIQYAGSSTAFTLYRNSNTGGHATGLVCNLQNSSSSEISYAAMYGAITTATAGNESGNIQWYLRENGAFPIKLQLMTTQLLGYGITAKFQSTSSIPLTLFRQIGTQWSGESIYFNMQNAAAAEVNYGQISVFASDVVAGSEDGYFLFSARENNVMKEKMILFNNQLGVTNTGGSRLYIDPVDLTASRVLKGQNQDGIIALVNKFQEFTDGLKITDDDSDVLTLYRTSSNTADSIRQQYSHRNSSESETIFSEIKSTMRDATAGSEDGRFEIFTRRGGNLDGFFKIDGQDNLITLFDYGNHIAFSNSNLTGDRQINVVDRDVILGDIYEENKQRIIYGELDVQDGRWGSGMYLQIPAAIGNSTGTGNDADGTYRYYGTGTASNTKTGNRTTNTVFRRAFKPHLFTFFKIYSNTTNCAMFLGLASVSDASELHDTEPLNAMSGIGLAVMSGQANYHIVHNDGTGISTKINTGIAKSTAIRSIEIKNANNDANWTVNLNNGEYTTTISTDVPAENTALFDVWHFMNTDTTDRYFYIHKKIAKNTIP